MKQPIKGRSLKNTPSVDFYGRLVKKWQTFNKNQRLDNEPEVSLEHFAICRNIDLTGKQPVDLEQKIDLLNSKLDLKR